MLADIASGETAWADVLFLIALILFVIAAAVAFQVKTFYATVIAIGLACMAFAWLLL